MAIVLFLGDDWLSALPGLIIFKRGNLFNNREFSVAKSKKTPLFNLMRQ